MDLRVIITIYLATTVFFLSGYFFIDKKISKMMQTKCNKMLSINEQRKILKKELGVRFLLAFFTIMILAFTMKFYSEYFIW